MNFATILIWKKHLLLVDHLVVQRSLSFGIFLLPDLLGQGGWKVLPNDLVPMLVSFVVLGD